MLVLAAGMLVAQPAAGAGGSEIERLLKTLGQLASQERVLIEKLRANLARKKSIDEQYAALNKDTARFNQRAAEANAFCSGTHPEPEYSRRKAICAKRNADLEGERKALDARRADLDGADAVRAEEGNSIKTSYASLQERAKGIMDALARQAALSTINSLCAGQASLAARSKCLRDGWVAASAEAAKAEQDEYERMNAVWLRRQEEQVRAAVASDARWRRELLASIEQIRVPSPDLRPASIADAQPGDVLLLLPEGRRDPIPLADWIYRVAEDVASGESFRAAVRSPGAPVSHAIAVVKSVNGHLLFLESTYRAPPDHAFKGSRILSMADFERYYGARGLFLARPTAVVDGRELWRAARAAALQRKSDYGIFGDKVVCSERAGLAVAKATGQPIANKRLGPIDITPGDFFDESTSGKYFVIAPLSKNAASH